VEKHPTLSDVLMLVMLRRSKAVPTTRSSTGRLDAVRAAYYYGLAYVARHVIKSILKPLFLS
jgi:hypothetical protein